MLKPQLLLPSLALVSTAFAAIFAGAPAASLAKREDIEPGTPLYECHQNCGDAILISQATTTPCANSTFLSDYSSCLDCAGPNVENIWQYYGPSLTPVATTCGLSTTPISNSTTNTTVTSSTSSSVPPSSTSSGSLSSATATGVVNGTTTGLGNVLRSEGVGILAVVAVVAAYFI